MGGVIGINSGCEFRGWLEGTEASNGELSFLGQVQLVKDGAQPETIHLYVRYALCYHTISCSI